MGYRCDLQTWCSSHQCQHRLQAQLTHTHGATPHAHTRSCRIPTHQNWAGFISQVPDTEALQTHSLQSSGQPSEQWFFSTSTTSNIPWPYTTQRPTLITEARKERFLPFRSLPVTPHFPAHLGNGNSTGHCQVGSSGGKLTLGLFLMSSLCIRLRYIYLGACEFVCQCLLTSRIKIHSTVRQIHGNTDRIQFLRQTTQRLRNEKCTHAL